MFSKKFFLAIVIIIALFSCNIFSKLTSNISITPNNSFVLGDNEHGKFSAYIKNVSKQALEIYTKPINGTPILVKTLQPKESADVDVKSNTAVIIKNNSNETVSVDLIVKGDTGLSMGYKN